MLSGQFDVCEAENGKEAVDVAGIQKPDVILMDMMMPKMDGLTACLAIRQDAVTKSIPIIMVTAVGFELNVKLSEQMGANGYVTKPFSSQNLIDAITRVMREP
jgi:CheY-like chemotaxis protein